MKILIRNQGSNGWKVVDSAEYSDEAEFQGLLTDSPSLIPVNEIRDDASTLVLAIREFGLPGSGNTDILAFSADGDIAIVECKLAANPEIKRRVIGQILEYGAYLWGMTYEEIDQRVYTLRSKNLTDLVAESIGDPDWDEEQFRNNVKESLKSGAFILIIAVDEMNEELGRTIKFLNSCGNPAFSFHALEMRRFRETDIEILVPHLHGSSLQSTLRPRSGRRRWTEEEIFRAVQERLSPEVVQIIRDLYEWSRNSADQIWFGTGMENGSFTFHYLRNGERISVFTVYTNGRLTLNYGYLVNKVERNVLEEFHQSIQNIPSFRNVSADFSRWPSIRIADAFLNQTEAIEKFKEAVSRLGNRIHSSGKSVY